MWAFPSESYTPSDVENDVAGGPAVDPASRFTSTEAFVVAVPTPYFAVTKADGSYKIANVPDGPCTVKVWHPKLKAAQKTVTVAGATSADFEIAR